MCQQFLNKMSLLPSIEEKPIFRILTNALDRDRQIARSRTDSNFHCWRKKKHSGKENFDRFQNKTKQNIYLFGDNEPSVHMPEYNIPDMLYNRSSLCCFVHYSFVLLLPLSCVCVCLEFKWLLNCMLTLIFAYIKYKTSKSCCFVDGRRRTKLLHCNNEQQQQ